MDRYQQLLIDGVVGFMIFASAGEEPAAQAKPGESRRPSSLTASQKSHTPPRHRHHRHSLPAGGCRARPTRLVRVGCGRSR